MSSYPLVSVIIPTYNYAQFIITAIEKCFAQNYPRELIEVIVVDDGSIDDTKNVLKPLIENRAIKYFYQDNQGKASATFKAIQEASGKYIFNLDADDYFLDNKLIKYVEIFEANAEIVHVGSPAKILNQETNEIHNYEKIAPLLADKPLDGNWLLGYFYERNLFYGGGSTYGARASILKQIQIPPEVDMFIDELMITALLPYGKSYLFSEALSIWRGHNANYSEFNSNSIEKKVEKAKRLMLSCGAMFTYVENTSKNKRLINICKLRYLNYKISFKELTNSKSIADIITFSKEIFIDTKPNLRILKSYSILNRLMPTSIIKFLKKY